MKKDLHGFMSTATNCTQVIKTSEPLIHLETHRFEALFDPATGFLRRVRAGNSDVVLAIYGAVRDRDWNTVPPVISGISLRTASDVFELSFTAECSDKEAHFIWHGMIRGSGGELEFSFDGRAISEFYRNRIGLCILHSSVPYAGKPCRILKTGGTWEDSSFPRFIAPHQPFKQVKGMAWNTADGVEAEMAFEGEIFETEDQRNWTDASFKTYCTPLEIPFPVKVAIGTKVHQRVLLKVELPATPVRKGRSELITLKCADIVPIAKPPIGMCIASHADALSVEAAQLLRGLRISHLRVDLFLAQEGWRKQWDRALVEAAAAGAALHCALFIKDESELETFAAQVSESRVPIALCLVFDMAESFTPARLLAAAERWIGKIAPIAIGTSASFVDLNRNRPPAGALACFSINPQCHAFDDMSVMENLDAQRDTVDAAREFGCNLVAISPITLKPRLDASAAEPEDLDADGSTAGADPRQRTLFGAAWTLGSLARLAPALGVHSLTYYETTGSRGIIELEPGGRVFPSYHVFFDLADCSEILPMEASEPLCVAGLMLLKPSGARRILIANLTPEHRAVSLSIEATHGWIRFLDETTVEDAIRAPETFRASPGERVEIVLGRLTIELKAYAIARVKLGQAGE